MNLLDRFFVPIVIAALFLLAVGVGWYDIAQNSHTTNGPVARYDDPTVDGICGAHGFRVWYQPVGGSIAKVLPDPTCPK